MPKSMKCDPSGPCVCLKFTKLCLDQVQDAGWRQLSETTFFSTTWSMTTTSLAAGECWMPLQKGWPASRSRCDVCPLCCLTIGRAAACLRTCQVCLQSVWVAVCEHPPPMTMCHGMCLCADKTLAGQPLFWRFRSRSWMLASHLRDRCWRVLASACRVQTLPGPRLDMLAAILSTS